MKSHQRRTASTVHRFAISRSAMFALFLLGSAQLPAQDSITGLRRGFQNPPADARPMMRWWWFGPAVAKPELKKELQTMQGAGIGGVEIQPVYPLMLDNEAAGIRNLQYLSPEFLDDVGFVNTNARSLGLRVDITLGSGWPYGGPKTTLDLAAGKLKVVSVAIKGAPIVPPPLAEGDSFIAAFAVSGTEKAFDPATAKRLDLSSNPIVAGEHANTALFFISSHTRQMVKRAAAGAEGFVLDHFSRAAIDQHLADVATPLIHAFGDHPPYSVFSDSLEVYDSDWTADLPAEFLKRRGYDLIAHLPELLAGGTPQADAIRHDWGQTLSDLIRDNYLAPLTSFSEAHHTRFRSQTYGQPAVTLADEAIPNLPEGEGPQWRTFSFTRWASSASHLWGRNITSAETWTWLHSPAFRATPLDMKAEADRMFFVGVNQFVGHGYPYSAPAAGEPGWSLYAAAVFNSHNPWFPVMPDVTSYLQRVSWLLRQGTPANDIAILLPEDDAQAAFTPGHVSVTDEMRKRITPAMMAAILDAGYNVDYIDAASIDKLGAIPYPVLVIPPTVRIPLPTYRKIENFAAYEGKVIGIEKLPTLAPGLMEQNDSTEIAAVSDRLFKAAGHRGTFIASTDELADALHSALPPDVQAVGQTAGLGFLHRKLPSLDVYFVANTGNRPIDGTIQFRSRRAFIETWDPDSGKPLQVIPAARNPLLLAPYESRIFVLHDSNENRTASWPELLPAGPRVVDEQLADLGHGWTIRFGPNAAPETLRALNSWTDLPGRQFYSGEAIYSQTFKVDSKQTSSHGSTLLLDFGAGTPFEDKRRPSASGMQALLDPPIREAATVFINGNRVGSLWHPPYRIAISQFIHPGENQLEVHVYNTAINLLAGQPPRDYTDLRAKYGHRFDPQDMDHLRPIPSGLFGPIQLEVQRNK